MSALLRLLLPLLILIPAFANAAPMDMNPTPVLLAKPVSTSLVETDTEALLDWRTVAEIKPTLLLFSNHPFLNPIPEEAKAGALQLVEEGTPEKVRLKAVQPTSDPQLLPGMGLSAALQARLFSRVIWVLPLDEQAPLLDLEQVRGQLTDHGIINAAEAAGMTRVDNHITGKVRGTTLQIYGSNNLPEINAPLMIHVDLSFFSVRYRNEIKTPIYSLVSEDLKRWKQQQWPIIRVSISLGNLLGNVPLGMRFLGRDLQRILQHPTMLNDPLPRTWDLRARALYLENFFKKEEMQQLFDEMNRLDPNNPATFYSLYQVKRRFKQGDEALRYLADAVRLDPGYGLEYYTLADTALGKKRPDAALRMLSVAQRLQPANPVPLLRQLDILKQLDHRQPIPALLEQLRKMSWSTIYYPGVLDRLNSYEINSKKQKE